MGLIRYQRVAFLVDSVLQVQTVDVNVDFDSKAQEVETIVQGLAGFTPGAKRIEAQGTWALPVAGQEFDIVTAIAKGDIHQLQVPLGNKTVISEGIFVKGNAKGAVNQNSQVSANFIGTYDEPT